ncbi:MAG: hypothetical protein J5585_09090 [Clostridia bacterium]|nr:hypothetical protein [Clostridia bacterium]
MRSTSLVKRAAVSALVLALLTATFSLYSCSGYDPNRKEDETIDTAQNGGSFNNVAETQPAAPIDGDYISIGGGRDQVREINGVSVDVGAFARRSYELCYLLGQTSFASPSEISLDSAVLFAFCHLYYDELWTIPRNGNLLCTASADQITEKLAEYFGDAKFDVLLSSYYSSHTEKFEMFAPTQYGMNLFYNVDSAETDANSDNFMIYTSFYKDSSKKDLLGRTVLSLKISDGAATIVSLSSEY